MLFIQDMVKEYYIIYNCSLAIWGVSGMPNNKNPMQPMWFIMAGLKRPKQEEVDKLKGIKFKVLFKFKEENIQLKKKEFNCLYKDVKTNPAKVVADKKFSKLVVFFYTVILMF